MNMDLINIVWVTLFMPFAWLGILILIIILLGITRRQ
jgi:hypothetical protein